LLCGTPGRWSTEHARRAVKRRDGFSTLSAEQSHEVLRPFAAVVTDTSPEAIAPTLDGLLSTGPRPLIRPVDLRLSSRELTTEADVDVLLAEIRDERLAQIQAGSRVRVV
jgi:hypothetical protein